MRQDCVFDQGRFHPQGPLLRGQGLAAGYVRIQGGKEEGQEGREEGREEGRGERSRER